MRSSNETSEITSLKLRKSPVSQRNMLDSRDPSKVIKLQVLDQPAGLNDNYETTGDFMSPNVIDEVKTGMDMSYDDKIVHGVPYPTAIGQWKGNCFKHSPRDRKRQKATLAKRRAQAKRKFNHLVTCIKRIAVISMERTS